MSSNIVKLQLFTTKPKSKSNASASAIVSFFSTNSRFQILQPLLNLKDLLADPEKLKLNAQERRVSVDIDRISSLNSKRTELSRLLNQLNAVKKKSSISSHDLSDDHHNLAFMKAERKRITSELNSCELNLSQELSLLPNSSSEHSPLQDNLILKENTTSSNNRRNDFAYEDHVDICKKFDLVDFEGPARTSGAHFYALKGIAALLEMTLVSWAFSRAISRGFVPISAPDCIRERFVVGCGFQPRRLRGENDQLPVYQILEPSQNDTNDPLLLAGTSEIFLASQHHNQIISSSKLPLKYVAVSHCFRSEVGHHTAASRGLYRVHQFTKVELFTTCKQEESIEAFAEITDLQGALLDELKLPYRVLEMARWELGAAAHRKWDHEVWMPGRGIWGEVMSTSNCTDYQARRLAIRHRTGPSEDLKFPHTLNGTACAVPRIIMALLENGLLKDSDTLHLPSALEPFYPSKDRVCHNDILKVKFV